MIQNEQAAAIYMDIDSLVPWGDNPRDNDQAVDAVADSIKRFGFGSPIVARKDDLMIIKGHTRRKAAIKLGLSKVPVRLLDIDLVDAQLLALADNKIGEIADWNDDKLSEIIHNLKEEEVDISGLGFSDEEIERLSELVPDPDWKEFDEAIGEGEHENQNQHDQIPDEVEAITKPGERVDIGRHVLHCGDCIEVLKSMPSDSVDAVVCDPPYGIGFMSKDWDCSVPSDEWATECLRVLKPGGHLIAFAATRTIHRLMIAVEDSGFEIRDMISWCYFSGFPKSLDVSKAIDKHFGVDRKVIGSKKGKGGQDLNDIIGNKDVVREREEGKGGVGAYGIGAKQTQIDIPITAPATEEAKKWSGWGTALKPAVEPAVLARKPLSEKTVAENVLKWGTGGLNIDRSRFGYGDPCWVGPHGEVVNMVGQRRGTIGHKLSEQNIINNTPPSELGRWPANLFQCPKASRSEREEGCEDLPSISGAEATDRKPDTAGLNNPRAGAGRTASEVRNIHPTVKPVKLMRWLIGLVTPEDGIVLDTFAGSGTTLVAAQLEEVKSIGIEREPGYCDIIRARLQFHI
tara:strand:+ start:20388 stop:22103 length:1716 start_codon:yes stop_codon:yes gene_type:complete